MRFRHLRGFPTESSGGANYIAWSLPLKALPNPFVRGPLKALCSITATLSNFACLVAFLFQMNPAISQAAFDCS